MRSISRRNSLSRSCDDTCPFSSSVATRRHATNPNPRLRLVELARQWRELAADLPPEWAEARLVLELEDPARADRVGLILGPFAPGRTRTGFQVTVPRDRDLARYLARLDEEGVTGRLVLVEADQRRPVSPRRATAPRPLAEQWDELASRLPPDWSDLYAELELDSSDYLERGALLLAPVNPARYGGPSTFRFRVASSRGYGAAAPMTRRCLERLDGEGITGTLRALRVLSQSAHVATQGPVWYVEGKAV
jgi:hypothetical protein